MNLFIALLEDRRLGAATLGAMMIAGGAALPWVQVPQPLIGTSTGYGLQDDGKITLVIGLLALGLVLAYAALRQRDLIAAAALGGVGAAGIAGAFLLDIDAKAAEVITRLLTGGVPAAPTSSVDFSTRVGIGIWVTFGGAAMLAGAATLLIFRGAGKSEPATRSSA